MYKLTICKESVINQSFLLNLKRSFRFTFRYRNDMNGERIFNNQYFTPSYKTPVDAGMYSTVVAAKNGTAGFNPVKER